MSMYDLQVCVCMLYASHVSVCMCMYMYRKRRQWGYNGRYYVGESLVLLWFIPGATIIWGMVARTLVSAVAV